MCDGGEHLRVTGTGCRFGGPTTRIPRSSGSGRVTVGRGGRVKLMPAAAPTAGSGGSRSAVRSIPLGTGQRVQRLADTRTGTLTQPGRFRCS